MLQRLLDPNTFVGNVAATVAGVTVVSLATWLIRASLRAWRRVSQLRMFPYQAPTIEAMLGHVEEWIDAPLPSGTLHIDAHGALDAEVVSLVDWAPGELETFFCRARIPFVPIWMPGNLQRDSPQRISCRNITVDAQMGGFISTTQSGWLMENVGACRTMIHVGSATLPARHAIKLTVQPRVTRRWSGYLAARFRVNQEWRYAYCRAVVAATEDDGTDTL